MTSGGGFTCGQNTPFEASLFFSEETFEQEEVKLLGTKPIAYGGGTGDGSFLFFLSSS